MSCLIISLVYLLSHGLPSTGRKVIDSLSENDLPKRYPTLFERIDCKGGGIWNKVTNEKITGLEGKIGVDALKVCARSVSLPSLVCNVDANSRYRLVEDDFLMGREREDGHVYFTGGLVAFPGIHSFT